MRPAATLGSCTPSLHLPSCARSGAMRVTAVRSSEPQLLDFNNDGYVKLDDLRKAQVRSTQ
jgi:hypothetical protein